MPDTSRLTRRPEARAFSVETLLQMVQEGKLRLPDFQRPQRWRSSHVISFYDSIYRGYPVGELLLSRHTGVRTRLRFGPVEIEAPELADSHAIVDGQQRITALAGALLHPDERPYGDIHAIWFDLEREEFKRCVGSAPASWIPLNVVGDSFKQLRWLNDWPLRNERPDLVHRALVLGKALREFQVPAYVLEGASEETLRQIFKRTNASGVEMKEHEIFDALYGGQGSVRGVAARLEETGFGALPEDWIVRCLKAVEEIDPRRRFYSEDSKGLSPDALARTETALRRVIVFLTTSAAVPHQQLLPYRLPLVVLARLFHLHPNLDPRTEQLLVRWLWRGALSRVHANTGDVVVAGILAKISADLDASIEALLRTVPRATEPLDLFARWNGRNAETRVFALALFHLGARDPLSGDATGVDGIQMLLSQRELGEVFLPIEVAPQQRDLWHDVQDDAATGRSEVLAGRFLVADRDRLLDIVRGTKDTVLRSHGLDADALASLQQGDLRGFEARRERLLRPMVERFFRERAALDESDRPSIASLLLRADPENAA